MPNNISKPVSIIYVKIPEKSGIDNMLYLHAVTISNFIIEINPRVRPQPIHLMSNRRLAIHKEHPNISVSTYNIPKRNAPANIVPISYRLALMFSFNLYQRLTKTISETAA